MVKFSKHSFLPALAAICLFSKWATILIEQLFADDDHDDDDDDFWPGMVMSWEWEEVKECVTKVGVGESADREGSSNDDWRLGTGDWELWPPGNMPQIDELKMQPSMPGPSVKLAAVLA